MDWPPSRWTSIGPLLRVAVAWAVTWVAPRVAVSVQVVVAPGVSARVSVAATVPIPWLMLTESASVTSQARVTVSPAVKESGVAVNETMVASGSVLGMIWIPLSAARPFGDWAETVCVCGR